MHISTHRSRWYNFEKKKNFQLFRYYAISRLILFYNLKLIQFKIDPFVYERKKLTFDNTIDLEVKLTNRYLHSYI